MRLKIKMVSFSVMGKCHSTVGTGDQYSVI